MNCTDCQDPVPDDAPAKRCKSNGVPMVRCITCDRARAMNGQVTQRTIRARKSGARNSASISRGATDERAKFRKAVA